MNKSILLGRLTKAPEIRYSQKNNMKAAKFTLAVNRQYVKAGEERQTDFINIVAFSKLAEFAEKYLKQGVQICLCGRIQTRTYEDNKGQIHYVTEVIADEIAFADSMKKQQTGENELSSTIPANENNTQEQNTETAEEYTLGADDLPF